MRAMQFVGFAMILVGLLFVTNIISMVTVVVDTTPPEIAGTMPTNGGVYAQLTALDVHCRDLESGIKSVQMVINGTSYGLKYQAASPSYPGYDWWMKDLSYTPINTPGKYTYTVTVTNNAGLQTSLSGTFTIYTQLQGKWYINDIEITSSSQTIYSQSATVSFKFQKTAGIDDKYISCWVEEGGTKILTLSLTDSTNHVWTGSYTFTSGRHLLTLKASDGTSAVTMSIASLQAGETWELPRFNTGQLFGFVLMIVGAVLALKKRW